MAAAKPRLLSITEAAEQLQVSPGTLRRWADDGKIPTVRLPSGYRRFEPAVIERMRREMGYGDGSEAE